MNLCMVCASFIWFRQSTCAILSRAEYCAHISVEYATTIPCVCAPVLACVCTCLYIWILMSKYMCKRICRHLGLLQVRCLKCPWLLLLPVPCMIFVNLTWTKFDQKTNETIPQTENEDNIKHREWRRGGGGRKNEGGGGSRGGGVIRTVYVLNCF